MNQIRMDHVPVRRELTMTAGEANLCAIGFCDPHHSFAGSALLFSLA